MSTQTQVQTGAIVVLDASGSMAGQEGRVVSSMNEYVAGLPSTTSLQVYLFDSERWDCHFDDLAETWDPMTLTDYRPGKMTPLYDAIGKGIVAAIGAFDETAKVMVMIDTDGMENASREHNSGSIKAMVETQRAKGWEFLFMSQGLDTAQSVRHGYAGQAVGMAVQSASAHNRMASYQAAAGQTVSYFAGVATQSLNVDEAVKDLPDPKIPDLRDMQGPKPEPVPAGKAPVKGESFF